MARHSARALALIAVVAAAVSLRSAAQTTATGFILGRVIDAITSQPVASATVTLGGSRVLADGQGRFLFRELPRGRYDITATAPGYLDGGHGQLRAGGSRQPFPLDEGQRVGDVTIRLWRASTISGTLTNEIGDPMVDLSVLLLRREVRGERVHLSVREFDSSVVARTDDRGMFEFSGIEPGEYLVSVPSRSAFVPVPLLDAETTVLERLRDSGYHSLSTHPGQMTRIGDHLAQTTLEGMSGGSNPLWGRLPISRSPEGTLYAYSTTFHPSATNPSGGVIVSIKPAEARSGVDLQLRPVSMVALSGTVAGPDGPESNLPVHLVPSFAANQPIENTFVSTTISDATGRFTFPAVAAGDYVARAFRLPRAGIQVWQTDRFLWGETAVAVGSAALSGVSLNLRSSVTVSGRVEFVGAATPPPQKLIQASLLRAFEPTWALARGYGNPVMIGVTPTGTFTAYGLPPGRHVLKFPNQASASISGWYFESATLNGRNQLLSSLTLEAGRVDGIVIRFTDKPIELSGTVRDARGVPDLGAVVVVFPADFRAWIAGDMNTFAARAVPVSDLGVYEISDLTPGDYLVAAINEEQAARWQQTSMLEAIASSATRVTLSTGARRLDLSSR